MSWFKPKRSSARPPARSKPRPKPRPKTGAKGRAPLTAKDRRGLLLFGGIAAVIVIIVGLRIAVNDPIEYHEDTLCALSGPVDHLVVLIDKSDAMTPSQTVHLRQVLEEEVANLAVGERMSLFVLNDANYELDPLFSKCSPGDGSTASPLYQSPARLRLRFDEAFIKPFEAAVSEVAVARVGSTSPIMEMIQQITTMPSFKATGEGRRRLLIVSDMLQNMPYYSQYNATASDYDRFLKGPGRLAPTVLLGQVDVRIVYLVRDATAPYQGRNHIDFWERWIADMGGHLMQVDRVR